MNSGRLQVWNPNSKHVFEICSIIVQCIFDSTAAYREELPEVLCSTAQVYSKPCDCTATAAMCQPHRGTTQMVYFALYAVYNTARPELQRKARLKMIALYPYQGA